MMQTRTLGKLAVVAFLALTMAPQAFGVGTGGTGLRVYARGALALAGGVVVQGITFDPTHASISINHQPGRVTQDLSPGMVANVYGDVIPGLQSGIAGSIQVTRVALGSVTQVGTGGTGLRYSIVGMLVSPRADVIVAGCPSLADIAPGVTLDVYGYSDGVSGWIDATRIECVAPTGSVEVHGIASAVTSTTMVVQGVTVDISGAQFVGFSMRNIAGERIEVKGTESAQGITATVVTFEPDSDTSSGEGAEVEDAISLMISPYVFVVDGFEIDATHAKFSGGTAADLAAGRVVHVAGTVVNGIVSANSVEFDDEEAEDDDGGDGGTEPPHGSEAEDISGAISAFTSVASFVVKGIIVDASAATFVNANATALAPGKVVSVTGGVSGNTLIATKVRFLTGHGETEGAGHHAGKNGAGH